MTDKYIIYIMVFYFSGVFIGGVHSVVFSTAIGRWCFGRHRLKVIRTLMFLKSETMRTGRRRTVARTSAPTRKHQSKYTRILETTSISRHIAFIWPAIRHWVVMYTSRMCTGKLKLELKGAELSVNIMYFACEKSGSADDKLTYFRPRESLGAKVLQTYGQLLSLENRVPVKGKRGLRNNN